MFTMTTGERKKRFRMTRRQIARALSRNRRLGRRPWSLYQIAKLKGVSRSLITTAVKTPARYPEARQFIESLLIETPREKAS